MPVQVSAVLDGSFPNTAKRRDRNCISMQFSEFRLDLVPAFKVNSSYYKIPDSIAKSWVPTDPTEVAAKITQVNSQMGSSFVPLIKMVKGWNRQAGWPIRSFHLECMMYDRYKSYSQGYTYPSVLKLLFEDLPSRLALACFDATRGSRVDMYLDNAATRTNRQIAIDKARSAAEAAAEAYEDQGKYAPVVSINEWKRPNGRILPQLWLKLTLALLSWRRRLGLTRIVIPLRSATLGLLRTGKDGGCPRVANDRSGCNWKCHGL